MVEKVINIEVKACLQQSFETKEINSEYSKGYKPPTKKNTDKTNSKY